MYDESKTKQVLILEMASLRPGSNELKQSESECKKEKAYGIIKSTLLIDLMQESNEWLPIFVARIKSAKR
jgi:hypothetical protein